MNCKQAPYLKKGATIGIVSTASIVHASMLEPAVDFLKTYGFRVLLGEHVYAQNGQFAGSDSQRANDLQKMIDNPDVNAIICSRGGYGTIRILEGIDWNGFKKHPKWIVGFSDVSSLHAALHQINFASIHGVMPRYFSNEGSASESFSTLINALSGKKNEYSFKGSNDNRPGTAEAPVVGGNLSILYSLRGTPYDLNTDGKILLIEDLSEYLYHLDRIMMNLKTGGKLKNLAGLIVGAFTGMKDHQSKFGKTLEEIIRDAVDGTNFPVAFNFPVGHQEKNYAIKLGCNASLKVGTDKVSYHQQ